MLLGSPQNSDDAPNAGNLRHGSSALQGEKMRNTQHAATDGEAEAEPIVAGFEHDDAEYSPEAIVDVNKEMSSNANKLIMKNGCCRECMKAFSKSGKSCLCQVPRMQRRATLPANGCKFCGCKGCNPIDIRRDKRQELKNNLQKEGKLVMKR